VVSVTVGNSTKISTDALLDFSVAVTFDGQPLDEKELRAILESSGGLVALKGKWVELDRDRLAEALKHWKNVERTAQHRGISFFEGMRMLSGANLQGDAASLVPEAAKEWVGISAGQHLEKVLQELRHPERAPDPTPPGIRTDLRPYQQIGVHWLRSRSLGGLSARPAMRRSILRAAWQGSEKAPAILTRIPARLVLTRWGRRARLFRRQRNLKTEIPVKEEGMELRRSRWILGAALASFAVPRILAGVDEPNFTEEQKIDFLQHAKIIASKPEKKGKPNASHLTLSDGKVTYDASFQPIDERKAQGPAPGAGIELNFRDYWGYDIAGYRIAKLLGMDDMVPVYTERKWNGTTGAISWRVSDVQSDDADRFSRKIDVPASVLDGWNKQMYNLRVLTQLFYDMDDNLTNVLITKDWKIWRIDFSRAFRLQHDLKNPKDLVQCDREVLAKLRQLSYEQVFDATKPYLTKNEVKALIARRDKMVAYFDELVAQKGESKVLY
jgi:hypothetical protein